MQRLRQISEAYRTEFARAWYRRALGASLLTFAGSVVVSFYAITYATERASNPVTDIVLSNIPAIEVDGTFALATIGFILFAAIVLLSQPRRIPFSLNALALLYAIRSGFITLTHIGPFPTVPPDTNWGTLMSHFLFSGDLFFSGHVGGPFLLALIFWRTRSLRYVFLGWSVAMAVIVLLGHFHYSIDVASAYFITYSIFHIAMWAFPKTYALFQEADRMTRAV